MLLEFESSGFFFFLINTFKIKCFMMNKYMGLGLVVVFSSVGCDVRNEEGYDGESRAVQSARQALGVLPANQVEVATNNVDGYCTGADYNWQNQCLSSCWAVEMLLNGCSRCDLKCRTRSLDENNEVAHDIQAAAGEAAGDTADRIYPAIGSIFYKIGEQVYECTTNPINNVMSCVQVAVMVGAVAVSVAVPPVGIAIAGGVIVGQTVNCAIACNGSDPDLCRDACANSAASGTIVLAGTAAGAAVSAARPVAVPRPPIPYNTAGTPGPGITEEVIAAAQAAANQFRRPLIIFGSRQTGFSCRTGLPYRPNSDVDLAVTCVEDILFFADDPLLPELAAIPFVDHCPMCIMGAEEALQAGYFIVYPQ